MWIRDGRVMKKERRVDERERKEKRTEKSERKEGSGLFDRTKN